MIKIDIIKCNTSYINLRNYEQNNIYYNFEYELVYIN